MFASIIIITKNQIALLKRSILILKKQQLRGKYEIIVVDSGSKDDTLRYLRSEKIRVVNYSDKPFNYAVAFNKGASVAIGKFLVRLSGDCIPVGSKWLYEILKPFSDQKIGGTFGKYVTAKVKGYDLPLSWPASKFPEHIIRYEVKNNFLLGLKELGKARKAIFSFTGGACAFRKSIWNLRGFNQSMSEGEDGEYAWFIHLLDFDILYTPHAKVVHEHKIAFSGYAMPLQKFFMKLKQAIPMPIVKYWLQYILIGDPYRDLKLKITDV